MLSPSFWHKNRSLAATLLSPFGFLYGVAAELKQRISRPQKLSVPVLCIGNVVLGGAGKTPTAIAVVRMLQTNCHTPHILSRGYGRSGHTCVRVDPDLHSFADVGDEPLLLAQAAPTWVYHDRVVAGQQAIAAGATILMMDDGYQNTRIVKDRHLLVVDAAQSIGNGKVFPAGPLREFLGAAMRRADAVVLIGGGACTLSYDGPVFCAHLSVCQTTTFPPNTEVIAFAGIGYPPKFRKTLEEVPLHVKQFTAFPDHHPYTASDIEPLLALGLPVITTEKDYLRVPSAYQSHIHVLKVELQMTDPAAFQAWLIRNVSTV